MLRVVTLLFILWGNAAFAQEISLNLGQGDSISERSIFVIAAITVISIAPGILIMVTCFPFMVTVLSILRQGLGLQQSPPNIVIVSLAMFLTWFVMEPVFMESWNTAITPMRQGEIALGEAIPRALEPFRQFMETRVDPETLLRMTSLRDGADIPASAETVTLGTLVPSFILSEISRAFQVGFLVFLPFLIIDLVVSAILMSMGMMMVPPAVVALPFKLAFFVIVDGWVMISDAMVRGYMS